MRVLASEIIRRSLDLADIQNTDFLSHEEKTKYLNEAWINLYQLVINKGVKQFVKEVELQNGAGGTDFTEFLIPSDLWQVCSLKNKYSGSIIPRHAESESIASNSWEIVNDRIRLYGAMTSPLLLTYWAVPAHVTFPNKSIPIENKAIEMGISNSILYKDGELKNVLTGEDLGDLSATLLQDHYSIGNELCLVNGNYVQEYQPAMCTSYGHSPSYYIADGNGSNKLLTDYYSVSYLNPIFSKQGDGYVNFNEVIWRCNGIFSNDKFVLFEADSDGNPKAVQELETPFNAFKYEPDSSLKNENRPALLQGTFHPIKWESGKKLLQFYYGSATYFSYDYTTDRGFKRIIGYGGNYTVPSENFTTTSLSNIYCTDTSGGDYFLKKDGNSWLILDVNDEFVELPSYFTVSGDTLYDNETQEEYTLHSVTNAWSITPNTNIWFRLQTFQDSSDIYTTGDNLLLRISNQSSRYTPYFNKYTSASSGTTLYFITNNTFNYNATDIPDFFEDIGALTLAIYQEFNIQSNATDKSTKICAPVASFDAKGNVTLGESILGKFGLFTSFPRFDYSSQIGFGTLGLAVQYWTYTVTDYENTPLGSSYGSPYFDFYQNTDQNVVCIYDENYNLYAFQSIGNYKYKILPVNALATGLFAQDVHSVSSNYLNGFEFTLTVGSVDDMFAIDSCRAINENLVLRIHQENLGVESNRNVICTFQLWDREGNVVAESDTFQATDKDWLYEMPTIRSTDRFDGKLAFNMFAAYETTAYSRGVSLLTVDIENNEWEIIPVDLPNGLFETFTKYGPVIARGSNKTLYSNIPDTEFNFPNDIYYQVLSADLAVRYAMKQNIDASGLQALYQTMVTTFENTLEQDSGYNRMQNIYR